MDAPIHINLAKEYADCARPCCNLWFSYVSRRLFLDSILIITDRYGHVNFTAGVLNPTSRGTSDQIDYFMSSQATQHEVFRIHPLRQVNVVFSVAVGVLLVACNSFSPVH